MALTKVKTDVIVSLDAAKITGLLSAIDGTNLENVSVGSDQVSRNNLALNVFEDSVRHNMDRLSLSQGWIDVFKDADDVDGEGVSVRASKFDGNVDYLSINTSTSSLTDGDEYIVAFWLKADALPETKVVQNTSNSRFNIQVSTGGSITCLCRNASGSNIASVASSSGKITVGNWHHVIFSFRFTASPFVQIVIDGELDINNTTNPSTNETVNFRNNIFAIGANPDPSLEWEGEIAQYYIAAESMDFTNSGNIKLFYNNGVVDLGSNGEKPTSSTPLVYLNNPYDSFQTNLGTGGNFSVNGELVDGGYANDKTYDSSTDSFSNSYEVVDSYGKENQDGTRSLGDSGRNAQKNAQCITLSSEEIITKVGIYTKGESNPVNNCWVEIQGVTGTVGTNAVPNNNIIAKTNEVPASSVSTSFTLVYFTFAEPVVLAAGDYSIVFNCEEVSTGFMHGGHDNTTPSHSGNQAESNSSGGWSMHSSWDNIYYLYGQKNLDLITKGSDDIGNSPSVAPTKGHMEVLLTERPAGGTSVWSDTLDSNTDSVNGYSLRQIILASDITNNANRIRVTLEGSSAGGTDLDNVAIVERSGNTSHGTTIPTEIFFGGSSGVFIPEGGTVVSDWCDFKLRNDRDYLVVFDITNNLSGNSYRRVATGGNGHYFKPSSASYNTPALDGPTLTLLSTRTAIITKLEVETQQTLNTGGDIIGQMSRDGGSTWDDVSLTRTETQVSGTNRNLLGGEVTFTGAAETNVIGRIKTENKDKITVHGISVNWS